MRQPTRTACLSLLYAIALSARLWASNATQDLAQELKVHWKENPAPNVHFELKEAEREKQGGTTHVAYRLETAGFPAGKTFALWIRQSGNQLIFPVLGNYGADSNGKLVCPDELPDAKSVVNSGADKEKAAEPQPPAPGEKKLGCMSLVEFRFHVQRYHKGEPLDLALVSTDGTVRAFAHAYPFPIWAQDGKCSLTVELNDPEGKFFTVLGEGFDPGETVKISTSSEKETKEDSQQASPDGGLQALLAPRVIGKESGSATFTAIGNSCHPKVTFEWGKRAMKIL